MKGTAETSHKEKKNSSEAERMNDHGGPSCGFSFDFRCRNTQNIIKQ
jgi:hypothetical protein